MFSSGIWGAAPSCCHPERGLFMSALDAKSIVFVMQKFHKTCNNKKAQHLAGLSYGCGVRPGGWKRLSRAATRLWSAGRATTPQNEYTPSSPPKLLTIFIRNSFWMSGRSLPMLRFGCRGSASVGTQVSGFKGTALYPLDKFQCGDVLMNKGQYDFLFWMAAIWGCTKTLPPNELAELKKWDESRPPDPDVGTSDWPGFEKYIGLPPWRRK